MADQHLPADSLPASRPDVLARPKAYTDLLAALDSAGWTHYARWGLFDDGLTRVKVIAVAPWDERLRIEATWESCDGQQPLKRTWCATGRPYSATEPTSLKAVHELLAAKPEARDDRAQEGQ